MNKESFNQFQDIYNFVNNHRINEIAQLCVKEVVGGGEKAGSEEYPLINSLELAKQMWIGCFVSPFIGCASVYDYITDLKINIENYKWVNEHLSDQKSKDTYFHILKYRLFLQKDDLAAIAISDMQYYSHELLPAVQDAVLVDCGAFDGETTKDFISVYGNYHKIYAYEPAVDNYYNCCNALRDRRDVTVINKGLADEEGSMRFTSSLPDAANRINPGGDITVDITTLDLDIADKITFIKMDIEGAEQSAIIGAKKHISEDKPQMAICLYHTIKDIWKIPQMIYKINPQYKFYMRYHKTGELIPEEFVLYADPIWEKMEQAGQAHITRTQILDLLDTLREAFEYVSQSTAGRQTNDEILMDIWNNTEPLMEGIISLISEDANTEFKKCFEPVIKTAYGYLQTEKENFAQQKINMVNASINLKMLPLINQLSLDIKAWI